jgi:hypothetical protein
MRREADPGLPLAKNESLAFHLRLIFADQP